MLTGLSRKAKVRRQNAKVRAEWKNESSARKLLPTHLEAAAQIIVVVGLEWLPCLWAFARIVRGRQVFGSFFLCWASLVIWHLFFIAVLPLSLYAINEKAGRTFSQWVPEGPAVIAVAFVGWIPAGVTVLLGILTRDLTRHFGRETSSPTPSMMGTQAAGKDDAAREAPPKENQG